MKSIVIAAVVAVGMAAAGTASAQEALAKSSGCLNCHDVATKKMGPASSGGTGPRSAIICWRFGPSISDIT